jgi:DNA-binding beta-propeller fold protein YncE
MKRIAVLCACGAVAFIGIGVVCLSAQNPLYERVDNWPKSNQGRVIGSGSAVAIDLDGRSVWIADACGNVGPDVTCHGSMLAPIMKLDASGSIIKSFGSRMFATPHGIHIDREGNIWIADRLADNGVGHQVVKLDPNGKVLMRLGKAGTSGTGPDMFNEPSAVITSASGDIFVADGHGGESHSRIVKFAKDGKFIREWGKRGSGPGQFNVPHSLAIDAQGHLLVGDRGNNQDRIQVFDQDGRYLGQSKVFGRPSGLAFDKSGVLFVTPGVVNPMSGFVIGRYDNDTLLDRVAYGGAANPGSDGIAVDQDGNVYLMQTTAGGIVKFARRGPR